MIERSTKLVWSADSSMPSYLVPYYLKQVEVLGGVFMIYREKYISAKDAGRNLRFMKQYIAESKDHFTKYMSQSSDAERTVHKFGMLDASERAGSYFRLYLESLVFVSHSDIQSEIPPFVSSNSELRKAWDRGCPMMPY